MGVPDSFPDLGDARYAWPTSHAVALAARAVACWRCGLGVQRVSVGADADGQFSTARPIATLALPSVVAVGFSAIHAERSILRLPETQVRARHAAFLDALADMVDAAPSECVIGDVVAHGIVAEHVPDICELADVIETRGTLDADDLMTFALTHNLMHRPPLLLALPMPKESHESALSHRS